MYPELLTMCIAMRVHTFRVKRWCRDNEFYNVPVLFYLAHIALLPLIHVYPLTLFIDYKNSLV